MLEAEQSAMAFACNVEAMRGGGAGAFFVLPVPCALFPWGARWWGRVAAYATIKGFEVMRALRKGQARAGFRPPERHHRRSEDRRAGLRRRTVRSD